MASYKSDQSYIDDRPSLVSIPSNPGPVSSTLAPPSPLLSLLFLLLTLLAAALRLSRLQQVQAARRVFGRLAALSQPLLLCQRWRERLPQVATERPERGALHARPKVGWAAWTSSPLRQRSRLRQSGEAMEGVTSSEEERAMTCRERRHKRRALRRKVRSGAEAEVEQYLRRKFEGRLATIAKVSKEDMDLKISISQDLFRVLNILEPGLSKSRGITLLDLAECQARDIFKNETDAMTILDNLVVVEEILAESYNILKYEDEKAIEGNVAKKAKTDLHQLRQHIASLKSKFKKK